MGDDQGKLTVLAYLLVHHAGAVEADLFPGLDIADLWAGRVSIRRVWVLVRHRLLMGDGDDLAPRPGTALARSIDGERGDWSRLDQIVGSALHVDLPEPRRRTQWKAAQQARLKEIRERRAREVSSG